MTAAQGPEKTALTEKKGDSSRFLFLLISSERQRMRMETTGIKERMRL